MALFRTGSYSASVRLLAIDILLVSLIPLFSSALLGAGRLREIAYYGIASASFRWLATVLLLLCGLGVLGVVLGWIMGDSLAIALYSASYLLGWRPQVKPEEGTRKLIKWVYENLGLFG